MSIDPGEVTRILAKVRAGEPDAESRLVDLVYTQLRRLASVKMRGERPNHTLTPTALAHEAFMQLRTFAEFHNRQHFLAIAANAMRRILIDHARARSAQKRDGVVVSLDDLIVAASETDDQLLALDEALKRLSTVNARAAQVVELRHFGGLQQQEIADLLNVDRRTVDRDWKMARAWLFNELTNKR